MYCLFFYSLELVSDGYCSNYSKVYELIVGVFSFFCMYALYKIKNTVAKTLD